MTHDIPVVSVPWCGWTLGMDQEEMAGLQQGGLCGHQGQRRVAWEDVIWPGLTSEEVRLRGEWDF